MKKLLLLKPILLLFALIAGVGSTWAADVTLTNADIVAAGAGDSGYKSWTLTDGEGNEWNAFAIKNQHSNATSSYHYLQIKKYASNTAYYIQLPTFSTKITSITMTVSSSSQPMTGGGNSATLFFSASNSTSSAGTGVASATGTSSVTINCSDLNLKTGYITSSGAVRIWDVKVNYENSSNSPLASIAVDVSSATTVFHVGDTFTHEGAVVTATYEDNTTKVVTDDAIFSTPDLTSPGNKTVTVSYTENNVTKETSYNVVVPTLSSISLSGTYPTVFNKGGVFSSEGIVVSANYNDESTKDVTTNASFTGYDLSTTGDQTVTVSYTEGEVTKTATYGITVNEFVQPTSFDIPLNGTSNSFNNGSTSGTATDEVSMINNNVTVTYSRNGSNLYTANGAIRFYQKNTLKFDAPTGYNITSIVLTQSNTTADDITANTGSYDSSSHTWTGEAGSVTLSRPNNASGYMQLTNATITLEKDVPKVLTSISLSGDYPIEFIVGDEFSAEGMVVTATYEGGSTEDVTTNATFSGYNMDTEGEQTVTVSYTRNEITKTATYTINVNPIPVKTIAEFIADEGGKCYLIGTISNDKENKYGNYDLTDASGTIYVYGTLTSDGVAQQYLTLGIGNGDMIKVLANQYLLYQGTDEAVNVRFIEKLNTINVSVSSAKYATFSDEVARDFSGTGITVLTAKANGTSVTMKEVTDGIVPANTGVVLYSDEVKTNIEVPFATASATGDFSENEMIANVKRAIVKLAGADDKTNYILSNEDDGVGFYKAAANGAYLPANRAYLSTTATATGNAPFLGFDGNETTGINSVERGALSVEGCYTLDGRRVAQPTKGLYIVNGRKVIIK